MISVALRDLLPRDPRPRTVRIGEPVPLPDPSTLPIAIGDARALQVAAGGAAACLSRHGFALIDHVTAVGHWRGADNQVAALYHAEIDAVVRDRLFPGRRVKVDQSLGALCRGEADETIYGEGVHQDFGLNSDDFAVSLAAALTTEKADDWRARYDAPEVTGCIVLSCWRTIGMRDPLRHMPIALCDPETVEMSDVIASAVSAAGSYHIALRYAAGQRWYHYPGMRPDELLVFKLFECRKDDPGPSRLRSVFHTAFADPDAPADAERRHSCEHRAIVTLLD